MDPTAGFATQLADAARAMHGSSSTRETLDRVVSVATELIHGCDLVGISLVHRTGIDTPAASDEVLRRVDELQFELKEGPCFDTLRNHETVCSSDLARDPRWPRWGPLVASEVGALSIVSFRLFTTADTLGALNLYARKLDAFNADDVYDGHALAAHVAVALAAAENVEHLETAIDNRTVIGRAEGILMERFDLSASDAFAVLRRVSQHRNVRLHLVADELVRTRQTPE
ncbi:GAF and ANTAR domain-containing protein [Nocardioides panacis]|uniref:GAF and ANTAR domain-containing protein n=1 Tax=Nocardioides panacis TaxID=2849501 RepID=A0A975SXG3_9ACTN|nr:GAF and ANTAR domain-containing protein [Nocardioides panacis]QWZ07044.1 GAF and ANTAR domain-containing protein [Nocardioides panacis]